MTMRRPSSYLPRILSMHGHWEGGGGGGRGGERERGVPRMLPMCDPLRDGHFTQKFVYGYVCF